MKLKGAQIIVKCIEEQGIDTIYGYPGGSVLDIFDALYEEKDKLTQVLTCHEQGASHAADGYARATGKTGVVIATSGPGATNLVTGIATAYMDSVPLVAITGNVGRSMLGRDSFQEVDITGITIPVTKHNFMVKDPAELADTLRKAFFIAGTGRPGPVLVDVPKDVQQAIVDYEPAVPEKSKAYFCDNDYVSRAVDLINASERPVLYVGGGCITSGASDALVKFSEKINAPVASSMMGLGCFPASHPNYLGLIGMHGMSNVAETMQEADLIIAVGCRFDDRVAGDRKSFCPNAKKVHIDIDLAELGKNVSPDVGVLADARLALEAMLPRVNAKPAAWIEERRDRKAHDFLLGSDGKLCPIRVIKAVQRLGDPDKLVATDVGQHQMWVAQAYDFDKPRKLISSCGLGTMGYGMGAAIGACMGSGKQTVLFTGDGSFHMNFNELVTASKLGLDITVFVMDNHTLGMVRQWQTLFYHRHYSSTDINYPTDFVKLAEALGAKGFRLERNEDIDKVVQEAFATKGVKVVDCIIDKDEFVLPMIPPGKNFDAILTKRPVLD